MANLPALSVSMSTLERAPLRSGEVDARKISGRPTAALRWLEGLEGPFRAVYEAGPTGYRLARQARERGIAVTSLNVV